MKINEIRELTDNEIRERELTEVENLTKLRLNHSITQLDNPHLITEAKKSVARLKTERRMRELKQQQK
jgi:large subunit ribosomal protein L29